jgi:hypothetical protein
MNLHVTNRVLQGNLDLVRSSDEHAIWSRFASPRAEVRLLPSLSRANLFAGD